MPYVRLSTKEKQTSIAIEQVFAGYQAVDEVKALLLASESVREDIAIWFDVVIEQVARAERQLFVAKYGRLVVGYMILKPQERKISSIYVERAHRGKRVAEALYGMGVVSLGTPYPYTAFVHDMIDEFRGLVKVNRLVLDDTGPLCVLNPGDGITEEWGRGVADNGISPRAQNPAPPRRKAG